MLDEINGLNVELIWYSSNESLYKPALAFNPKFIRYTKITTIRNTHKDYISDDTYKMYNKYFEVKRSLADWLILDNYKLLYSMYEV